MEKRQSLAERKIRLLFLFLPVLTCFMLLVMGMRVTAAGNTYLVLTDSGITNPDPSDPSNPNKQLPGTAYDAKTLTLTLSNSAIDGTLQFYPLTIRDQDNSNLPEGEEYWTEYTVVVPADTKSTIYALDLGPNVSVTIKGGGELLIQAPDKNVDLGAGLTFNDKGVCPELIIESGTFTVDATYHGTTLSEAGRLYIKEGVNSVTFIGRTNADGTKNSVIPTKDRLKQGESIPKIFSDVPCQAEYLPTIENGKKVILSPNGTSSGSGKKTNSDASLLSDDQTTFYILTFKPGHTATWKNDDADNTVLEEDRVLYWDGQTPEYNGNTPTKEADAQYTYTFSGWSPTPAAIYEDTVYTAVYTTELNEYTVSFNANGHGTAPASQTVAYGKTASKPNDLTADGYTFGGWYTEASCTNAYNFSTAVTADITLYAKWTSGKKQESASYDTPYIPAPPMSSSSNAETSPAPETLSISVNELTASVQTIGEYEEPYAASFAVLKAQEYKASNDSITIGWDKVPGAVGYAVYGAKAGKSYRKLSDVTGTSFIQKDLVKGASYKYFIAAYDADGNVLVISKAIHVSTGSNNPKSVKVNVKKESLAVGETFKIKASVKGGKGQNSKKIRYESGNPAVATVSANGTVTAAGPGKCTIYVFAQNGSFRKVKVTVK